MPETTNKFLASRWAVLLFIAICFAAASFGTLFSPGDWYANLNKAPWSPPNMAFPIVWTFLYLMIAVAGWLIFRFGNTRLQALWIIQLIVNAAWSWIFFGQHWMLIGLVEIVLLCALVLVVILDARKQELPNVVWLLSPYLLWLLLATTLNAYVVLFN